MFPRSRWSKSYLITYISRDLKRNIHSFLPNGSWEAAYNTKAKTISVPFVLPFYECTMVRQKFQPAHFNFFQLTSESQKTLPLPIAIVINCCISIFHKTEILTVILRCLVCPNLNLIKSYDMLLLKMFVFSCIISEVKYRRKFWYLRRKPAVMFSKWVFFQNSFLLSWPI